MTLIVSHQARSGENIPVDIRDEVELWARQMGRHAKIVWNPILKCGEIQIDFLAHDPRRQAWQEGKTRVPPVESVFLHRWDKKKGHYVAMDLAAMGASGLRNHLDATSVATGRGEHRNLQEAFEAVDRKNDRLREEILTAVREGGRENANRHRRKALGLPQVQVTSNLEP